MSEIIIVEVGPCLGCGQHSFVEAEEHKVEEWRQGAFIQDVFPEMTPEEREFLKTGTHSECWNRMFGPEDEEDDLAYV